MLSRWGIDKDVRPFGFMFHSMSTVEYYIIEEIEFMKNCQYSFLIVTENIISRPS